MAEKYRGRRRNPGRCNPLSELAIVASRASSPAIKGSAVLAASGGLVAAFAIPANAVGTKSVDAGSAASSTGTAAAASISERASEIAASRTAARPALTAPSTTPAAPQTFGVMTFTAVEKPPPPPPPPVQRSTQRASGTSTGTSRSSNRSSSTSASSSSKNYTQAAQKAATGGVLSVAASLTGIPYRYGGSTPAGFDCSGFTQYVFKQVGISLGRTTYAQYAQTRPVSNPQPGDLVFFGGSSPHHVGIYAGNGMMYDSPRTGKSTTLRKIFSGQHSFRRV